MPTIWLPKGLAGSLRLLDILHHRERADEEEHRHKNIQILHDNKEAVGGCPGCVLGTVSIIPAAEQM